MALPLASITVTFDRDMCRTHRDCGRVGPQPRQLPCWSTAGGERIPFTQVSYDAATRTTTLRFEPLAGDSYTLTVDKRIRSAAGLELTAALHDRPSTPVQDFSPLIDVDLRRHPVRPRRRHRVLRRAGDQHAPRTTCGYPLMLVLDPSRYFLGTPVGAAPHTDGLWLLDLGNALPNGVLAPGASTAAAARSR